MFPTRYFEFSYASNKRVICIVYLLEHESRSYRIVSHRVDDHAREPSRLLESDPKSRNCRQYLLVMAGCYSAGNLFVGLNSDTGVVKSLQIVIRKTAARVGKYYICRREIQRSDVSRFVICKLQAKRRLEESFHDLSPSPSSAISFRVDWKRDERFVSSNFFSKK